MHTSSASVSELSRIFNKFNIVDLSPVIEKGIPKWPTHPHLVIDPTITHEEDGYYCQTISMAEHTGSHVDSPAHIHQALQDRTIETFPAQSLIGEAIVYRLKDLKLRAGDVAGEKELLRLEENMEDKAGFGDIVLLDFGWQQYWLTGKKGKYYSTNAPGLDESAVKLLSERRIKAIGSDTIACDQALKDGVARKSYAHDVYCLPNDILIMEGLMNLEKLPDRCFFVALPLKIKRGSGSPIRPIAIVPKE